MLAADVFHTPSQQISMNFEFPGSLVDPHDLVEATLRLCVAADTRDAAVLFVNRE